MGRLQTLTLPSVSLKDGLEIPVGWSSLIAKEDAGTHRLVLHEPDFAGNPLEDVRPDVTTTLALHSTQLWLAKQMKAAFSRTTFRQKVAVVPGCLSEERLVLLRTAGTRFEDDSGWLVFPDGPEGPSQTEREHHVMYAFEIMKQRPVLVQALCLPVDFMARFKGDTLDSVGLPH